MTTVNRMKNYINDVMNLTIPCFVVVVSLFSHSVAGPYPLLDSDTAAADSILRLNNYKEAFTDAYTVDPGLHRVTALTITSTFIKDIPNEDLQKLTELKSLTLKTCSLSEIPEGIKFLGKLTTLDLFNMCEDFTVASGWSAPKYSVNEGSLPQSLEKLVISFPKNQPIPASICLPNLKELTIWNLSTFIFPPEFVNLHSIAVLAFYDPKVNIPKLPPSIYSIPSLKEFWWVPNQNSMTASPKTDSTFPTLVLSDSIKQLTNLETIYIKDTFVQNIPDSIGSLKNLKSLIMLNCGIRSVPSTVGNIHSLVTLDMTNNSLKDVPEFIEKMHLMSLGLESNNICSSIYLSAPAYYRLPGINDDWRPSQNCSQDVSILNSIKTKKRHNSTYGFGKFLTTNGIYLISGRVVGSRK